MSQENHNSNYQVEASAAGKKLFAQATSITPPKVKAETTQANTYGRKSGYRPKTLALMIRRAIIQMRGAK